MSAVEKLLQSAKEALKSGANAELEEAINALSALGDKAKGISPEYKALKKLMAEKNETEAEKPKVEVKYNFAGIKQIGSKWYCEKDKYQKGFDNVDECAKHFNSVGE